MVSGREEIRACDLLPLPKEPLGDARASRIPLFTELQPTPEESLIGLHHCIRFFNNPHPPSEAIIAEFRPIRANVDRNETIRRVPFIGIRRGSGHNRNLIPVKIEVQRLCEATIRHHDLVFVGRAVVAGIRRFD